MNSQRAQPLYDFHFIVEVSLKLRATSNVLHAPSRGQCDFISDCDRYDYGKFLKHPLCNTLLSVNLRESKELTKMLLNPVIYLGRGLSEINKLVTCRLAV